MPETAQASSAPPAAASAPYGPEPAHNGFPPRPGIQTQFLETLQSLRRLGENQLHIWLTRAKMAVMRMVLVALLVLVALVVAILGIIFLYAGVFHILTDVLLIPTMWTLLIFAGIHLLLAGVLVVLALSLLNRGKKRKAGGAT